MNLTKWLAVALILFGAAALGVGSMGYDTAERGTELQQQGPASGSDGIPLGPLGGGLALLAGVVILIRARRH